MSGIFFELRKALFGVSLIRDAADQLETAMRARAEAAQKKEQAEFDAASNALNIERQTIKIERLVDEITQAACSGKLSKRELRMVKPLVGEVSTTQAPQKEPIAQGIRFAPQNQAAR